MAMVIEFECDRCQRFYVFIHTDPSSNLFFCPKCFEYFIEETARRHKILIEKM